MPRKSTPQGIPHNVYRELIDAASGMFDARRTVTLRSSKLTLDQLKRVVFAEDIIPSIDAVTELLEYGEFTSPRYSKVYIDAKSIALDPSFKKEDHVTVIDHYKCHGQFCLSPTKGVYAFPMPKHFQPKSYDKEAYDAFISTINGVCKVRIQHQLVDVVLRFLRDNCRSLRESYTLFPQLAKLLQQAGHHSKVSSLLESKPAATLPKTTLNQLAMIEAAGNAVDLTLMGNFSGVGNKTPEVMVDFWPDLTFDNELEVSHY